MKKKALLVPINSKGQIYIQDREGHLPPPWGFFGGGIEVEESPVQAVIRESKEELNIDLAPDNLIDMGMSVTVFDGVEVERTFFLYKTDRLDFTVLEGRGGEWVDMVRANELLLPEDKLDEVKKMISSCL